MAMDEVDVDYVAAAPGFDVLTYLPTSRDFNARPVVAWAVTLDPTEGVVHAYPVSVGRDQAFADDPVVRLPTGEVVCGDMEWSNTAKWLDFRQHDTPQEPKPTPQQMAPVLALDAFRNRFKGAGDGRTE